MPMAAVVVTQVVAVFGAQGVAELAHGAPDGPPEPDGPASAIDDIKTDINKSKQSNLTRAVSSLTQARIIKDSPPHSGGLAPAASCAILIHRLTRKSKKHAFANSRF